jgi:hypothetical protein
VPILRFPIAAQAQEGASAPERVIRTRAQAGRYNVRIPPVELVCPDLRPAPPYIVSMNDKKHSKNKRLLSVAPMMDWTKESHSSYWE